MVSQEENDDISADKMSTTAGDRNELSNIDLENDRRHRRVYIGNLPAGSTQLDIVGFFNGALLAVDAQTGNVESNESTSSSDQILPVERCESFNEEARYCFIELRNGRFTHLCLKLDGITYNGTSLRIGRPNDYIPPPGGDPALQAYCQNHDENKIEISRPLEINADTKIYIQNLPLDLRDEQIREFLEQHGSLKVLNLIKNVTTGHHKGYGFFQYEDPTVTDTAIKGLNGFQFGKNTIKVQRTQLVAPIASIRQQTQGLNTVTTLPTSMTQKLLSDPFLGLQVKASRSIGEKHSRVLQLLNAVFLEDLVDQKEFQSIYEDVKSEGERYGQLERIVIPKPREDLSYRDGIGKIFLYYSDVLSARKAQLMLNGRKYDNSRVICAAFYPEDLFLREQYTLL